MSSSFVSRFTPSLMTSETLESLFVQRQKLAEQVLDDIRHSAESKSKHYNLLVGPRGFGKTHFVSVIRNRVADEEDMKDKLLVAWLREEERGVTSFLELLMRILLALARERPDDGLNERIQYIYDLSRKDGERAAAELLVDYVGCRTLLLIVENLDSIFVGLKDTGQKALRAFLQEHPICTIVATSTALFSGVSLQTSVFYGFFRIHHLEELSLDDAIELLASIAKVKGDSELASFIRTPTGRARIRAIHHLAGGNHRVYVVFSEFLTAASLDQLVDPFMCMLDDLTPYYQGRMDLLSPQQQQMIEFLAHAGAPRTVKEIAKRCFMTQQTAANQLRDLKEKGYLMGTTPERDKRETYYELREPLMRLCFEVKEYRGGPIRLFVDFLRSWYSTDELSKRLDSAPATAELERACLRQALDAADGDREDPRVATCRADLRRYVRQDDREQALQATEELVAIRGSTEDYLVHGLCLMAMEKHILALEAFDRAYAGNPGNKVAVIMRAQSLVGLARYDEALTALDGVSEPIPDGMHYYYWDARASALYFLSRYDESLMALERATESRSIPYAAWMNRGRVLYAAGRYADALSALETACSLKLGYEPLAARLNSLVKLRRFSDALMLIEQEEESLLQSPISLDIQLLHGQLLVTAGRHAEGLLILNELVENGIDVEHKLRIAMAFLDAGRFGECMSLCRMIYETDGRHYRALSALIVMSITAIKSASLAPSDRDRWLEGWIEMVENDDPFDLPLRLLRVAVDFLNGGDDRSLLALPVEARAMIDERLDRQSVLWD